MIMRLTQKHSDRKSATEPIPAGIRHRKVFVFVVVGLITALSIVASLNALHATFNVDPIQSTGSVVIDAQDTPEQALRGSTAPAQIRDRQRLLEVHYHGMDGKRHRGQIVADCTLVDELRAIFHEIDSAAFPLQSVIPIVHFNWDDDASIAKNNTSAFNYRCVSGTKRLSKHASGMAIDVNPYLNPWVGHGGSSQRPYDPAVAGTITENCIVVRAFRKRGWTWGGHWKGAKDYQHFDKR